MGITNFPNGVGSFGVPVLPASQQPSTGAVFFVHSGTGSNGNSGTDPAHPFASIDYAVGQCTASKGDTIYVMPGHTETVTAANGLDLDVAGIRVVGVGWGAARPVISVGTATTASVRINANGVWLENVVFTGDVDNLTAVLTINGKTDVTLKDIQYRDVTGQCAIFLSASDGSDRLTIDGLRYIGDGANAGTTKALAFDGCDDLVLRNFNIYGNFSTTPINFVTTLSARVHIYNGYIWQENSADTGVVDTITGSTGNIGPNLYIKLKDNAANITEAITGATFQVFDNVYVVNLVNEKAILINWTASADL